MVQYNASGTVRALSTLAGVARRRAVAAGAIAARSTVTGAARRRAVAAGVVRASSTAFGALSFTPPAPPPTILMRPVARATIGGVALAAVSGEAALDATRVPYAVATLETTFTDEEEAEALNPRVLSRGVLTAGDEQAGTGRVFDLGFRNRTIDHKARTIRLELASDEAILMETPPVYGGVIARDIGAFEHQQSLRAVNNYVLSKIGAELAPGVDDADVTTYTDSTNIVRNPRARNDLTDWATSQSIARVTSGGPSGSSTYVRCASGSAGTLLVAYSEAGVPIQAGKRYWISVWVQADAGTLIGIDGLVYDSSSATPLLDIPETALPADGNWTRRVVEFTAPEGSVKLRLRAFTTSSLAAGRSLDVTGWRVSEEDPRPGVENAEYYDGDTVDTAGYLYEYTGAAGASSSKRTAIIERAPELLIWETDTSAWNYLTPINTAAGLRLFCDEKRVWRLINPAKYAVTGMLSVTQMNTTEGTDTISRDDPDVWCTCVIVNYRWKDAQGVQREATDIAGTPGPTLTWEYKRPYPGPGAAAAILARREGAGRVQDVTALVNWAATPGTEARVSLPGTITQRGRLQAVTWSLDNGLMRLGTGGLLDLIPGSIAAAVGTIDAAIGTIDEN